jgi:protein PhnA
MRDLPPCPKCTSAFTYLDRALLTCPECGHEWSQDATPAAAPAADGPKVWKDANGNVLQDGDSVTIIKDLKVRGATSSLKVGTKVRNIRLIEGDHDIDCKIDGFGAMQLKSEYVRKTT